MTTLSDGDRVRFVMTEQAISEWGIPVSLFGREGEVVAVYANSQDAHVEVDTGDGDEWTVDADSVELVVGGGTAVEGEQP